MVFGLRFTPALSTCSSPTICTETSNKLLGFRLCQYLEIAKTGRFKKVTGEENNVIETRKKFFTILILGLLKTALKENNLTLGLLATRTKKLANYLDIEEGKVLELLELANSNLESFDKVKPFTLEQTEEIHKPASPFYQRLDHLSAIASPNLRT